MQNMLNFATYILNQLPSFLMSEPICYIVGFAFLGIAIKMFLTLIGYDRKS